MNIKNLSLFFLVVFIAIPTISNAENREVELAVGGGLLGSGIFVEIRAHQLQKKLYMEKLPKEFSALESALKVYQRKDAELMASVHSQERLQAQSVNDSLHKAELIRTEEKVRRLSDQLTAHKKQLKTANSTFTDAEKRLSATDSFARLSKNLLKGTKILNKFIMLAAGIAIYQRLSDSKEVKILPYAITDEEADAMFPTGAE